MVEKKTSLKGVGLPSYSEVSGNVKESRCATRGRVTLYEDEPGKEP